MFWVYLIYYFGEHDFLQGWVSVKEDPKRIYYWYNNDDNCDKWRIMASD